MREQLPIRFARRIEAVRPCFAALFSWPEPVRQDILQLPHVAVINPQIGCSVLALFALEISSISKIGLVNLVNLVNLKHLKRFPR